MSRSKRDILDTENMLQRLADLLAKHLQRPAGFDASSANIARADAESLRRISMTLRRWHEMECDDGNDFASWLIVRGRKENGAFIHNDNGSPFMQTNSHANIVASARYDAIPDREAGARKRLAAIMARYPSLQAYVQTDPRGCALYILKPGDVPTGENADSYYSRGLAVFQ